MDIKGKVFIVTGGASGLGEGTARMLAAQGGKVVIANAQPQVQKVFDIVKAVPLSEIFRSVEEADAYLDRIQKKILANDED